MGGAVLVFTRVEIDVLRLSAWCKDLPVGGTEIFPEDTAELLVSLGLIRKSRCGLSYRTTSTGYEVLRKAGFEYIPDKQYLGKSAALYRRLETATIAMFFWRYGADVFLTAPDAEIRELKFLPSFALRRKAYANILGGTRLAGFLYSEQDVVIPYYITPESDGIYANVEQRTFHAENLLCGKNPVVLYTGSGKLESILHAVTAQRCKKEKSTTDSYLDAIEKFGCSVIILPLNENGLRQLRIVSVPDYRTQLIHQILGKDYLPPDKKQSDGRRKTTKENFIIGIDCNIRQFENAVRQEKAKTHIILLSSQADAVQKYLLGKNAVLHPIEPELAEQMLSIPHELPQLNQSPFQTAKGSYINVPSFRQNTKVRR